MSTLDLIATIFFLTFAMSLVVSWHQGIADWRKRRSLDPVERRAYRRAHQPRDARGRFVKRSEATPLQRIRGLGLPSPVEEIAEFGVIVFMALAWGGMLLILVLVWLVAIPVNGVRWAWRKAAEGEAGRRRTERALWIEWFDDNELPVSAQTFRELQAIDDQERMAA